MQAAEQQHQTEALEVELLLAGVAKRYGYDFRGYARSSLMRRIRQAVRREDVPTVSALQARVLHDPAAMARFIERIAVHTTSMFRDADVYLALRNDIIPLLRTYPFIRIWHAGCSSGEEVYSLAIMLHEAGLYDRCRLYATDFSDAVISRARRGIFRCRPSASTPSPTRRPGGGGTSPRIMRPMNVTRSSGSRCAATPFFPSTTWCRRPVQRVPPHHVP